MFDVDPIFNGVSDGISVIFNGIDVVVSAPGTGAGGLSASSLCNFGPGGVNVEDKGGAGLF